MTPHRALTLHALLIALFLFPAGAGAGEYKVMDSGAILAEFPSIQWMDNDRVLFIGATNESCRRDNTPTSYRKPLPRIAEYDTRTGNVMWHGSVGVINLCYANGYVSYRRQIVSNGFCPAESGYDNWDFLHGPWGRESVQDETAFDPESCKPVPKQIVDANIAWAKKTTAETLAKTKQRLRMVRLREEHGWLAMHDASPRYPVAIYPTGKEDSPIPIDRTQFEPWLTKTIDIRFRRYEAFKDAYLLALLDSSGIGNDRGILWWLYPNGKLEHLLTYSRAGERQFFNYLSMVPTRNGVLMLGGKASSRDDRSGLYRHTESGRLALIDRGYIGSSEASLSPDGCKLAYGIDSKGFNHTPIVYRLHVVDVCAPRKR